MKNITFSFSVTAVTTVMTTDLHLNMHLSFKDSKQAMSIIQVNSEAMNKQVKEFIKEKSDDHKGTH